MQIVAEQDICTQIELTQALVAVGFAVTQATVSRDIKQLRLTKDASTPAKYVAPPADDVTPMSRVLAAGLVDVACAGHMLVLRTLNGMAMAVALALDEMKQPAILGSVAGDDTVIAVVKSEAEAAALCGKLRRIC